MTRPLPFGQWWKRAVRSGYGYAQGAEFTSTRHGIWKRERIGALLWGGAFPLAIMVGALIHPVVLVAALVYPVQVARIAIQRGAMEWEAWIYALLMTSLSSRRLKGY